LAHQEIEWENCQDQLPQLGSMMQLEAIGDDVSAEGV